MLVMRYLLVLFFLTSVSLFAQDDEPKAVPEVKTEVQKALDAAKKRKEDMEAEKAKVISVGAFNEQISKVCKASKNKKYDEIQKTVSAWKVPRADQLLVKAYGQVLGRKLSAGYGQFADKSLSDLASSPLISMLSKYSEENYQIRTTKLQKDRPPRRGLELELVATYKDGPVMEIHLAKGTERLTTASVSYYFVIAEGGWRCAGNSGYYDFNADKNIDPLKKQEPKLESFSRMTGALSRACKRDDKEEIAKILATWRIPKSDVFFKKLFESEGVKMDTNYETCMTKYVENPQSEITTVLAVFAAEASQVDKPDAKDIGAWLYKVAIGVGKEKSPLFLLKNFDNNAASSTAPAGMYYFLFIDGSFRLMGPRGFQDEGVLKPKEASAPAPEAKPKKTK